MAHLMEIAPRPGSVKKPYEAPKLVVLGDAREMTQNGLGALTDATVVGASNSGS